MIDSATKAQFWFFLRVQIEGKTHAFTVVLLCKTAKLVSKSKL